MMTDNGIIKALECCIDDGDGKNCHLCPLYDNAHCQDVLLTETIDLIKRQQTKIEELKNRLNKPLKFSFNDEQLEKIKNDCLANVEYNIKEIKSEAVKEFTERLKKKNTTKLTWFNEDFDELAKETEGNNDAFVEGTELALDYGLPVPEEDLEKYEKIVDKSKNE